MEKSVTPADNRKKWYVLSLDKHNRSFHRKTGPSQIYLSKNHYLNSIIWSNKGNYLRKDGPIVVWANKNLRWCIAGQNEDEEPYWNK